jgi:hypothetical protein
MKTVGLLHSLLRGIQRWIVVIWPIRPRSAAGAAKSIAVRFPRLFQPALGTQA